MKYRLPQLEDYEILKEYVIEHYSNHERSISASLGMAEAILGCYEDNFGSNKTIQKNNGILYRTSIEDKKLSDDWTIVLKNNYYRITL